MLGKTCCSCLSALLLSLFQSFPAFLLLLSGEASFFSHSLLLLLVVQPFLPANVADRLRGGFVECPFGVVAGLELSKSFGEPGQGKILVHAGRLDRRVSHENDSAGTLADETQTDRIQSGVKFLPACGVLDDGVAALLRGGDLLRALPRLRLKPLFATLSFSTGAALPARRKNGFPPADSVHCAGRTQ